MDFVKKRVWNNRVRFVTFASEMAQNILFAWTTPANSSTRTICYPRVDWPNSTLFTSIFLQLDILKQCLRSKRSVTGCRFQKSRFDRSTENADKIWTKQLWNYFLHAIHPRQRQDAINNFMHMTGGETFTRAQEVTEWSVSVGCGRCHDCTRPV